ncbi:hypothetical protein B0H15DRAFT_799559 [Mycena belliarum]|uniref:Uncharacterized protein n=1 Tax=Mycena belliarum TaxID=1033014 RepID=A0AAD6UB99_9AGAR|nr:hypothetical protein B0H15DRAFT_799559 [Mycena belliae]
MLCVVVYLYATSLTLWALNATAWYKNAHAYFMDYPEMPLPRRRAQAASNVAALGTPMEALFMFNMIVGDSVVIWRAWVLYQRTLWIISVPCLMLLMSFIFTIIDITCLTGTGWSTQTAIAGGGPVCARAELIAWAFSFITNATCTIMIGLKAWNHRKSMKVLNVSPNHYKMSTDKLLSVLVESGFIYCLFWLTQLILFVDVSRDTPVIYVYQLFSSMGDQISGMYPTLIIVIVNLHQTIWEPDSSLDTGVGASTLRWTSSSHGGSSAPAVESKRGVDVPLRTESYGMRGIDRRASEDV